MHSRSQSPPPPSYSGPSKGVAIILIGNAGSGKSALLNQLGGNFQSGVSYRRGLTKKIAESPIQVDGGCATLIDIPGLYAPDDDETENNVKQLQHALSLGYEYKIYFVLKADNRGPVDSEYVMMAKVNQWVKTVDGAQVTFRVIVNQIIDDEVYDMYDSYMAKDNFKNVFSEMNGREGMPYSFDIRIDHVLLLPYSKLIKSKVFETQIADDVKTHKKTRLGLEQKFEASNKDLHLFNAAMIALSPVFAAAAAVTAAIDVTVLILNGVGSVTRQSHKGIQYLGNTYFKQKE
ncbi:hypothetical protein BGZ49_004044 [Haplosporangium sp. Z 27]|nr:hypothetical protein BGZ49_004044 [Haplosporangium sp. Z 27]